MCFLFSLKCAVPPLQNRMHFVRASELIFIKHDSKQFAKFLKETEDNPHTNARAGAEGPAYFAPCFFGSVFPVCFVCFVDGLARNQWRVAWRQCGANPPSESWSRKGPAAWCTDPSLNLTAC